MKISVYSLNISNKFPDEITIRKERKNLYQLLKRYKDSNTSYKNISFIIGISNTSSLDAKVSFDYNNLRGKPKKIISGTKVEWHFHIYSIGDEISSASAFCNNIRIYITKKRGYKTSQNKNDNIEIALSYINKQCLSYWKCGNYF